ncbi:D-glucuronyl C5-epimerase-like [Styela clava]
MLCCTCRMIKNILNMRRNVILLVTVLVIGIFGTFQLFDYTKLCKVTLDSSSQNKRHKHNDNIDLDTLAELKKRWILEYEEEKKMNDNRNLIDRAEPQKAGGKQPTSSLFIPIHCNINGDYNVDCLRHKDSDDIYMPWTFLEKYYEVYGKLNHYDGYDRFEFFQSYNQVLYDVNKKYKYDGVFLTFETYNVEIRDRVKLITGIEGVPLSTQWGPQGYFYPIQIAQFGLSHFSKNITEKPPSKTIYEDGEMTVQAKWEPTREHCKVENIVNTERNTRVIKFDTPDGLSYGSGIALTLGNTVDFELSFDIKFITNGSLSVLLDTTVKKQYYIHYVTDRTLIKYDKDSNIVIGIGESMNWRHISRHLVTDLKKGVGITKTKSVKKTKIGIRKVVKLILRGQGYIDNITISTSDHMTHFLGASYWLLENQDHSSGGWPIMVERKFDGFTDLPPGWHSAMAQGHGLSTMVRAFKYTRNSSFLSALRKALKPYTVLSAEGGVKAVFMNKYVWYEEYPTTPGSFVLNGFIYSLLGLYDYKMLLFKEKSRGSALNKEDEISFELVTKLYNEGMTSLKNMLPLYDGGSRTFYDLRHFQLKSQPNIARWDYHTTHMSQLALLSTIDDDPIFKRFYEYWHNYLKGIPAKHN